MEITKVRVKLMDPAYPENERMRAFSSITIDNEFVVHDLKVIEGAKGLFVAMPSRKITDRCVVCGTKNPLRSNYCSYCGCKLDQNRAVCDGGNLPKFYVDTVHPINHHCREMIHNKVVEGYFKEQERAKQPGYVCNYHEYGDYDE